MIWDDDALLTAPAELYTSTSVATFGGIVTGVAAPRTNPLSHGDLLHALHLCVECLPLMLSDPRNTSVRMNLLAASFLSNRGLLAMGGRAFGINSSLVHVIATLYPEIRHGDVSSLVTAWGMRFNLNETSAGQARLAQALGVGASLPEIEAAKRAPDFIENFYHSLGMPVRLRDAGIPLEGVERIASDAMVDFYLHQNARKVKDKSELVDLLNKMW